MQSGELRNVNPGRPVMNTADGSIVDAQCEHLAFNVRKLIAEASALLQR